MNKHKPKYMNIVPPGLFRGAVAPPYAWEPRERDDWAYENPRRARRPVAETFGDEDVLGSPAPAQQRVDPRKARIQSIKVQIEKLRGEVQQLVARQHELVQAGKAHIAPKVPVGVEDLYRCGLRLFEYGDEDILGPKTHTPAKKLNLGGPAETHKGMTWISKLDRRAHATGPIGLGRTPIASINSKRRQQRKQAVAGHLGAPRTVGPAPTQSPEIIQIHAQIQQKKTQISNLVNELRQIRMQGQTQESTGLISNHRSCLRLLLK